MTEVNLLKLDWEAKVHQLPVYTVAEASRYLHIPVPTLNSWLRGRAYTTVSGKKEFASLIDRPNPSLSQLSFTNLIEAHVLRVIREVHQIPLKNVRVALDYMADRLNTPHPLVTKAFKTDGVSLFLDHFDELVNVTQWGQLGIKAILDNLLTRIEWGEQDIVCRLFPYIDQGIARDEPKVITIDPAVSFGRPTLTGTGIPTKMIADLYEAGDSPELIADEYDCDPKVIAKVIQFESRQNEKVA